MGEESKKAFTPRKPLTGEQYFTQQDSPNSSLFYCSEVSSATAMKQGSQGDQSFVSSHSLSEQLWLRSILKEWRKYAKQVKRDKQLFFAVRDFVIRRLTKKAYNAFKINYAHQMLSKHLNMRRDGKTKTDCLQLWRSKFMLRLQHRMFFMKYLEYRAAKL